VILLDENAYTIDCTLLLKDVTVEDAGKYKVTARNDLGESNATISLNFDSELPDKPTKFPLKKRKENSPKRFTFPSFTPELISDIIQ